MTSLWSGEFTSNQYSPGWVSGRVYVRLQDPVETKEAYQTTLTLYYDGVYRNGYKAEIPLTIKSSQEAHGTLMLTMLSPQDLTFRTTEVWKHHIRGTYSSQNPLDEGSFTLSLSLKNDLPSVGSLSVPHCTLI